MAALCVVFTPVARAVTVSNADRTSVTAATPYTYVVSAPTLTSLSPSRGPAAGGTVVTASGRNFQPGASVTFGGTPGQVTSVTATRITVTAPAHAVGATPVVVTNPDGQRSGSVNYTYR